MTTPASGILPPISAIQSIMDHVPIGIIAFNTDLIILGASRHASAMLGFTTRSIVGVTLVDAVSAALGDEAALNLEAHAQLVHTDNTPTSWHSCRLTAGEGQRFVDWEVRTMELSTGKGLLLTLIDVTAREQAKMKITATERSLRIFSEAVVDHALVMTDVGGVITDCNLGATRITGFSKEELIGKPVAVLYSGEDRNRAVPEREWQAAANDGSIHHKRWHFRKDGSRYHAEGIITNHNFPNEMPCYTMAFRDTTQLVRQTEELERISSDRQEAINELKTVNADLQQFASVASHDLQEPLRMVSGYLSMLRTRYAGTLDAKATEYIQFASDGAQRMARLIRSLLDIARIDHGEIRLRAVNVDHACDEALRNLRQVIQETGATIERSTLGMACADREMLVRLFQNLVGNALKFVIPGERPKVYVDALDRPRERIFRVKDHGIGISQQDQTRIFDAFERVHGRGEYSGNGLGLAICKGIVERHGGRLSLESEPGHGATFSFTLPHTIADDGAV
jgi:PAS domain S-box-containing protein